MCESALYHLEYAFFPVLFCLYKADTNIVRLRCIRRLHWVGILSLMAGISRASDYTSVRAAQQASIEKQLASVRAQKIALDAFRNVFFTLPAPDSCDRAPAAQVRQIVDDGA